MTKEIITDVLLALAVLTVAASALGVAVMKDAAARLHFVTPAAAVAPTLLALAIGVWQGLDENTGETFLALGFLVLAGPYLSHATIRAIRVRDHGDWRLDTPARPHRHPKNQHHDQQQKEESAS
ncbi:MAG TPA: monovalent cation/H(+) antiporter subunit G [Trebonia sp.]|jgi:multisubunit Na+/H+ antiporter MnhG subunit